MENRGVRNLFIFGSLFFFAILVALTADTMKQHDQRVPPLTEDVNAGKMVWHKYDCIGCHTILGNGSYFAPDLTKTAKNKPASYLVKFLMNPRATNPKAAMPNLGITEEEATKMVVFLDWISKVDTNGWPPEPVLTAMLRTQTAGSEAYKAAGCVACHMVGGVGGTSGPDLTGIGTRRPDAVWHMEHIKNPAALVKDSAMPAYTNLSDADLKAIADYMVSLK